MVVRDDDIKILEKFLHFCNTHEEFHVFFEPFAGISCGEFTKVKNDYNQCISKIEDITFNFVYNSLYSKETFSYECKNCKCKINCTMKRFIYRNFLQGSQTLLPPCGRPFCANKKDLIDIMVNDSFYHDMYHDLSYINNDCRSYCYMKIKIFQCYVCSYHGCDPYIRKDSLYDHGARNKIYSVDKNVYTFIQNYIKYREKIHNCMNKLGIDLYDNREYIISEYIKKEKEVFVNPTLWHLNNISDDSDSNSDSNSDSDVESDNGDSYRRCGIKYRQLGKIIDVTIYKEIYGIINILSNDSRIDELCKIYYDGCMDENEINIENLEKVILYYLKHKKADSAIVKKLVENIDFKCSDINKLVIDFLW
jgi:hypothetical protein